jgi:hypothetical protein
LTLRLSSGIAAQISLAPVFLAHDPQHLLRDLANLFATLLEEAVRLVNPRPSPDEQGAAVPVEQADVHPVSEKLFHRAVAAGKVPVDAVFNELGVFPARPADH